MIIGVFLVAIFFQNNPPKAYIFSSQIEENFSTDTTSFAYSKSAWEYASIGAYQKAIWSYDQAYRGYPTATDQQKQYFLSFKPTDGRRYILNRAKDEQIVMINEAHHQPLHRTFTTSLLEELYQQGYRFLGLEALAHVDTLLNERGYPVLASGYYTQEPQFGGMIREALQLGYTVFPYETQIRANGKEREIQQARNIEKVFRAHPEAKFLIHCGFDHINEMEAGNWEKAMAGRVKEYTGIDPFTINQEILTEHFDQAKENPYYQLVDTLKEVSVFQNEQGQVFRGGSGDKRFDVRLFHPRTTYIDGRPDWLRLDGKRKSYWLDPDDITIDYPILVKAYVPREGQDAIPVDVIEIKEYSDQKALILPEGTYDLILKNMVGDSVALMISR